MSQECIKLLGVWIDYKLDFSEHVSHLCKKASRQLNALSRISRYLDTSSKLIIYSSFINSNFLYCPLIWHFCGKVTNDKVEKLNERSIRIIYKDYTSSYYDLLEKSEMPTILENRLRFLLLEVFKCIKGRGTPCLRDLFTVKRQHYSFRHPLKIIQPKRKTTKYGLRSLSYLGAKLWNELPFTVCNVEDVDLDHFRNILKRTPPNANLSLYQHYL